jgi:deferrochelatase/peroxidase EfeB
VRSNTLGDDGPSAPASWAWGNADKPVDVLLMLFAPSAQELSSYEDTEQRAYAVAGLQPVVAPIHATELMPATGHGPVFSREHFGFADGISQPVIREHQQPKQGANDAIAAGEFILGYENEYGQHTEVPTCGAHRSHVHGVQADRSSKVPAFGKNGTYLAVRQFRQDVAGFWNFLRAQAGGNTDRATYLAAKIIGRWPSGALVKDGQTTDPGVPIEKYLYLRRR